MESFFAGLIGFLIGRGVAPGQATILVKTLERILGFEPPLGLTGYALKHMERGKKYKSSVVVRGKTYHAKPLQDVLKYEAISVLGKAGAFLQVAPQIRARVTERGYESVVLKKLRGSSKPLEPEEMDTVFDLPNKDITLERLVVGCNRNDLVLGVYAYNVEGKEGDQLPIADYDGSGWYAPQPININTYKSDIWEELVYDETNNRFKFALKRPTRFANGLKVVVYNPDKTESVTVSTSALATIR